MKSEESFKRRTKNVENKKLRSPRVREIINPPSHMHNILISSLVFQNSFSNQSNETLRHMSSTPWERFPQKDV